MLFFICDSNLNILLSASTDEQTKGYKIVDDNTTSALETGSDILELSIFANNNDTSVLKELDCGTFVLKEDSFNKKTFEIYQIITSEYDVANRILDLYAESAGVELLNTQVGAFSNVRSWTIRQIANYFMPTGWVVYNDNIGNSAKVVGWEGESSLTERLLSIANLWNARFYFTFNVENGVVTEKAIHFKKDSNEQVVEVLKLHDEISNIRISKDVTNLATCLIPKGATPEGSTEPINLIRYTYSYTDERGDTYEVDYNTGMMINITQKGRHINVFDSDGLIQRPYSFETTSQEMLAGQARAALQKISHPDVKYQIEIDHLDKKIDIGDIVLVLAEDDDIRIRARIVKLTSSYTSGRVTAEVEVIE